MFGTVIVGGLLKRFGAEPGHVENNPKKQENKLNEKFQQYRCVVSTSINNIQAANLSNFPDWFRELYVRMVDDEANEENEENEANEANEANPNFLSANKRSAPEGAPARVFWLEAGCK